MIGRRLLAAIALVCGAAMPARAQDVRLQSRIDSATFAAIRTILDSARQARLPTRPIEDKALEGAGSGASSQAIIAAVRSFTRQLGTASAMLGSKATPDELRAAVSAMDAGVPPRDLTRLHAATAPKRSIATALTVLGDIVVRGVPPATASTLLISLLRANVKDPDLLAFDRAVRGDIANGGDPRTAASARARGVILTSGKGK